MLARIAFAHRRRFVTKYEGQTYLAFRLIGDYCWLVLPGFVKKDAKHANA
jgi:hypothetical protein